MALKYESDILFNLMKRDGDNNPSNVLPYESELKEKYLEQVVGAYPKLQDYRSEWLAYNLYHHLPSDFPVESVTNVTNAIFHNVVPYAYGKAILKGQTLVNICKPFEFDIQTTGSGLRHLESNVNMLNIPLDDNKKYSVWVEIDINEIGAFSFSHTGAIASLVFEPITNLTLTGGSVVAYPCVKRKDSSNTNFTIGAMPGSTEGRLKGRIMVFEGDVRGLELSYFEGMQSVKLPVLTTSNEDGTKTNILSTPEDLELRGIGDVKDELDLLTGELTERVGVGNIKNFKNVQYSDTLFDGYYSSIISLHNKKQESVISTNLVPTNDFGNCNYGIYNNPGNVVLFKKGATLDEMKGLINQLEIQYELKTPVIKTVDLTCIDEQGENVNFIPIEGTMHVKTSSNGLQPLLDIVVPVEAITQNLNSFVNMKEE